MFGFIAGVLIGGWCGVHYAWRNDMPEWLYAIHMVIRQWRNK